MLRKKSDDGVRERYYILGCYILREEQNWVRVLEREVGP